MHPTCEHCQKNVATVHLTEIVEKTPRETHLCELCAQKLSVGSTKPSIQPGGTMGAEGSGVTSIGALLEPVGEAVSEGLRDLLCPECGMSWQEFRVKGRLGCSHDYMVFDEGLTPLIEKIQGVSPPEHRGKIPPQAGPGVQANRELGDLRRELRGAVDREDYERAAELRDRIQELTGAREDDDDGSS